MSDTETTEVEREEGHQPWDDPWQGVGVPDSSFWTDEKVKQADVLVSDLLRSDFDRVIRDGLSATHEVKERATAKDIPIVVVSNAYNEVFPIKYDNRHMTGASTENAIRYARGEDDGT